MKNCIARTYTVAFQGINAVPIDVQVQVVYGLPRFDIVGLPDKAVAESRERIRAALFTIGLGLPTDKITVNLSPADFPKEGSHYDLPIALAILGTMGVLPKNEMHEYLSLGELALDGEILPVTGVLPAALYALENNMKFICPKESGQEASWVGEDLTAFCAKNLLGIINHFKGDKRLPSPTRDTSINLEQSFIDIKDVKGQEIAKRAMEIAAAGGHNLVMVGPPGSGKSMLAERLPSLLEPLEPMQALESTMIHSIAGTLNNKDGLIFSPPYRAPHHSASLPSIVGGGAKARPGEISLAHNGVLFLDELPEFSRQALEALRQPLEKGEITISRASAHVTYPAKFQLVAAMNPCKCGYLSNVNKSCKKAPTCGDTYQAKISGPIWDRIDLFVNVDEVSMLDLVGSKKTEDSKTIRARVVKARNRQRERHSKYPGVTLNSDLNNVMIDETMQIDKEASNFLIQYASKFNISARSYCRIRRLALTIMDLYEDSAVTKLHIAEALSYKRLFYQKN